MRSPGMAACLIVGLCVAGCAEESSDDEGAGMAGRWSVTAVDGDPIPEGSSIEVKYRRDGEVQVEEFGNMDSVPPLDRDRLKNSMNRLDRSGVKRQATRVKIDATEVDLKRKEVDRKERGD